MEHDAVRMADDYTAEELAKPDAQSVLSTQRGQLRRVFEQYGSRVQGEAMLGIGQFVLMLKKSKLLGKKLSTREARFMFLSAQAPETEDDEPPPGTTADKAIQVDYSGFIECVARLARETTELDLIDTLFATVLQDYLLETFLPSSGGLGFFELKKTAIAFKRKTKAKSGVAAGIVSPQAQLGPDVGAILKEQSSIRTALFSLLANYKLDPSSQKILIGYLADMGLPQSRLVEIGRKMSAAEKLAADEKDDVKALTVEMGPAEEAMALQAALAELETTLEELFVYYGNGFVLDMVANPLGGMDAAGFKSLLVEMGFVKSTVTADAAVAPGAVKARKSALKAAERQAAEAADAEAVAMAERLLNIVKASRAQAASTGANRLGAAAAGAVSGIASGADDKSRWVWPAGAWQKLPPDIMTYLEFGQVLIRLAYELHRNVRGVTKRLRLLCKERLGQHWCLVSVDHTEATTLFEKKEMKKSFEKSQAALRKLQSKLGSEWTINRFDWSGLLVFLQACGVVASPGGCMLTLPRVRFLAFSARRKQDDKTPESIFWKFFLLLAKADLQCLAAQKEAEKLANPAPESKKEKPKKAGAKVKPFHAQFTPWIMARIQVLSQDWKKAEEVLAAIGKSSFVAKQNSWKKRKKPK